MNLVVFCMFSQHCVVILRNVLEVIAAVHEVSVEKAAEIIYRNTLSLYFPWELFVVCWKGKRKGLKWG